MPGSTGQTKPSEMLGIKPRDSSTATDWRKTSHLATTSSEWLHPHLPSWTGSGWPRKLTLWCDMKGKGSQPTTSQEEATTAPSTLMLNEYYIFHLHPSSNQLCFLWDVQNLNNRILFRLLLLKLPVSLFLHHLQAQFLMEGRKPILVYLFRRAVVFG